MFNFFRKNTMKPFMPETTSIFASSDMKFVKITFEAGKKKAEIIFTPTDLIQLDKAITKSLEALAVAMVEKLVGDLEGKDES